MLTVEPQLIDAYINSGQLQMVFQPVLDFNPRSQAATEAAYCAGNQRPELFWKLRNIVFERQAQLWATDDVKPVLKQFAAEAGADAVLLSDCLDRGVFAAEIVALDQARRDEGIRQRPSFKIVSSTYPSGRLVAGAQPFPTFQELMTAALGK